MNYSQKPVIDLFKIGTIFNESSQPKHIETVISNVFLFEEKVYKLYKNDNDFFNKDFRDLSKSENRFSFTEKDFDWNNLLSPDIYTGLKYIKYEDRSVVEVEKEQAEDIVMVMNKIDTSDILFEKLIENKLTKEDCFEIGKQLADNLEKVQGNISSDKNFYEIFESRINDVKNWANSVPDYVPSDEVNVYCDYLNDYLRENENWFKNDLNKDVVADGDFHSHNALYTNKEFYLMDTYPPKEEWGVGHKFIGVYRLGVDILALSGKEDFFEEFLSGYESVNGNKVDRKLDDIFIPYVSLIAVPYLYMLQSTDSRMKKPAIDFHKFLQNYFEKIK